MERASWSGVRGKVTRLVVVQVGETAVPAAAPSPGILREVLNLRCVLGEDEVVGLFALVAWKATLHRGGGGGFAIDEGAEAPAAGRGVFVGVLDHELNVGGGAGSEGLGLTEDFIVFGVWGVSVVQGGDDGAVGEREGFGAVGLDGDVVAENGADTVQAACLV